MKKYILGALAVTLVVAFSAFVSSKSNAASKKASYYWFETDAGTGNQSSFLDADVTFQSGPSTTPPTNICDANNNYKCIVGFSSSQVMLSGGTYHISSTTLQNPATSDGRFRATE